MKRLGLRLHADEEHWIPLSDLMTGLMILFLLISLAYMVQVQLQRDRVKEVATDYLGARTALSADLREQFRNDLPRWNATLDEKTLSVRFNTKDGSFATGSSRLQPRFQAILRDFFPRYLRVLTEPRYRGIISEVRVEGYTSSRWRPGATIDESYIGNMALSQDRARSVLGYVLDLPSSQAEKPWLMQTATANGLSFSHLLRHADGSEDEDASQRVEFRVLTNSEDQIERLQALSPSRAVVAAVAAPSGAPSWSSGVVGKPLRALYPKTSTKCLGYIDSMTAAGGSRVVLAGWGWDANARAPIARVLFVDAAGSIVGVADGGVQRLDVPAVQSAVTSNATGWQGTAPSSAGALVAWGVASDPQTVCRLIGNAR